MDPQQFRHLLKQTLEDGRVSRSERKSLTRLLKEVQPAETELNLYRQQAFQLARDALQSPLNQNNVLEWLEDVVRLLKPAQQKVQTVTSEAHFSPGEKCRSRIRSLLRQARSSVDICVFTITDNEITETIAEAHQRRIQVRIITDDDKTNDLGSDVERLEKLGVKVRHDNSPYHMHHKFAIFDESILLSGSYNWTRSAADNNEENIVIQNDEHLVNTFSQVFEELWEKYE